MAFVTPRMSLKVWNAASDPYDHEQLADNFLKLDQHDHSPGRGTLIGGDGIQEGAITTTHIYPGAIGSEVFSDGAISTDAIANGAVTDAKLASPNSLVWRNLGQATAVLGGGAGNATYVLGPNGLLASGTSGTTPMLVIPFNPTLYAVAGKTTTMRLLTNVTADRKSVV